MNTTDPALATAGLRRLASCGGCRAQYDVSDLAVGDRFHCACGALVTVTAERGHEAAVVRCSSCGGPRQEGTEACGFCGSDFTLHERDLHTICPGCAARISQRARFCHGCGLPISPVGTAGEVTTSRCPACTGERRLTSRPLGGADLTVLECQRCAGLWLGAEAFRLLEERARDLQTAAKVTASDPLSTPVAAATPKGPAYRACPTCAKLMHRRNYGRRSGVIIDQCGAHGLWFDHGELEKILHWIRDGGLTRSEELQALKRREEARSRTPSVPIGPLFESHSSSSRAAGGMGDFVGTLIDALTGWY